MIKVHHSANMRDTSFFGHEDIVTTEQILKMFDEGDYDYVAKVETDDFDDAYRLTNNINESWVSNEEVTVPHNSLLKGARSTSVGDILETDKGLFVVSGVGFCNIR